MDLDSKEAITDLNKNPFSREKIVICKVFQIVWEKTEKTFYPSE